MILQYMSDLHLEFGGMKVPERKGDILILAGDIDVGVNSMEFLDECADTFDYVLMVLGNHEFYHNDISTLYQDMKDKVHPNVRILQNDIITINDLTFAGCTLWSDMLRQAFYSMNDSNYISRGGRLFNYENVIEGYRKSLEFLEGCKDEVDIFITHHAPSVQSINVARYGERDPINTGYYTEILELFKGSRVKNWIHGHTHHCVDYEEHGIHVTSNQRGYVNYDEVPNFDPERVLEINE